ncbi:MAG: hypothetical protein IJP48_01390 [Synergistaceae bacterium]|nr:hypothetical protein [Synergistaceae bacterium]
MGFHWIVCEIFTRRIQPVYTEDKDENRYITGQRHAKILQNREAKALKVKNFLCCVI